MRMRTGRWLRLSGHSLWLCGLTLFWAASLNLAKAQEKAENTERTTGTFGARTGFSLDPDQFVLGGQVSLGKRLGIARVVPSVDVGLGSSFTTIAFSGDLHFRLNVEDTKMSLYLGAGAALVYADPEVGNSSWNLGLTLIAGARLPLKKLPPTSLEARFGVGDVPDFRGLLVFEL